VHHPAQEVVELGDKEAKVNLIDGREVTSAPTCFFSMFNVKHYFMLSSNFYQIN